MKFLIPEDEFGMFADQGAYQGSTVCLSLQLLKNSIITFCAILGESLHPILD